jgi:hypothetical protein
MWFNKELALFLLNIQVCKSETKCKSYETDVDIIPVSSLWIFMFLLFWI